VRISAKTVTCALGSHGFRATRSFLQKPTSLFSRQFLRPLVVEVPIELPDLGHLDELDMAVEKRGVNANARPISLPLCQNPIASS
jgi:hypothetical protein